MSAATVLETGFSAQFAADWIDKVRRPPMSLMPIEHLIPAAEERAIEVQGVLSARGQHRAPSVADLLVAATAEIARLTLLHADKDFELIAEITGQPIERLRLAE